MIGEYDNQVAGQMTLEEILDPSQRLIGVSQIFARARKDMSLSEQKTFVYALSKLTYTGQPTSEYVIIEKKVLAKILGKTSDIDHLSVELYNEIKDLPKHSYIDINNKDKGLFSNGFIVASLTRHKNVLRLHFNSEYLPLFTGLSENYITMWSLDIFKMTSRRSVQFYELLRQMCYEKYAVGHDMYSYGWGVKALKDMFGIPKEGKGSYMRPKGGFDRTNFEKRIIDTLCDDLSKCKMIQLVVQPDGKPYVKLKQGGRVIGYQFYWTYSAYPNVAVAEEVHEVQERIDKDPQVLKIAKDILKGEKKKNKKPAYEQRDYGDMSELEKSLTEN